MGDRGYGGGGGGGGYGGGGSHSEGYGGGRGDDRGGGGGGYGECFEEIVVWFFQQHCYAMRSLFTDRPPVAPPRKHGQ